MRDISWIALLIEGLGFIIKRLIVFMTVKLKINIFLLKWSNLILIVRIFKIKVFILTIRTIVLHSLMLLTFLLINLFNYLLYYDFR